MSTLIELKEREQKRQDAIERHNPASFDTEDNSTETNTLFHRWIQTANNPNEAMFVRTGETIESFLKLLEECRPVLSSQRKGKSAKLNPCDSLLLLLAYYRHYQTSEELAITTGSSVTTIQDTIIRTATRIAPIIQANYLSLPTLQQLKTEIKPASPLPDAVVIVDSVFFPSTAPMATFPAKKSWFSFKHHQYGVKYQILHSRSGRAISTSNLNLGSESDVSIYRSEIHDLTVLKQERSLEVIGDKGYQGSDDFQGIKTATPTKLSGKMTMQQVDMNKIIGKQRVLCENFYGRLKNRYRIMSDLFRGDVASHKIHFVNCAALTNRNILTDPLRSTDREFLLQIYASQQEEGEMKTVKNNKRRKEHYEKRKAKRHKLTAAHLAKVNVDVEHVSSL